MKGRERSVRKLVAALSDGDGNAVESMNGVDLNKHGGGV